jgi:hypothetical protein
MNMSKSTAVCFHKVPRGGWYWMHKLGTGRGSVRYGAPHGPFETRDAACLDYEHDTLEEKRDHVAPLTRLIDEYK